MQPYHDSFCIQLGLTETEDYEGVIALVQDPIAVILLADYDAYEEL